MFQTNLREIDADLDVEDALDAIQDHGANVWLLNVGGILSHYPTDLPFQTRNPLLRSRSSGDLVGDAVAAAHERGVRLLARMDFSKVHPRIAQEHPEWCFVSRTGELQVFEDLVSVCPSGEYYQERTLEIIDEVLDRYPVDGFFFNWFGFNEVDYGSRVHGVCHCSSCRRKFTEFTGIDELPEHSSAPGYLDWKRFSAHTVDALTAKIRAHIADRKPEAGLILGRSADILFHEANNALGRTLWPHATSEAVGGFRVSQPQKPVLVNSVAFFDMPYRMADEQPHMFAQYFTQTIARGGNPSTYIMGAPGRIRYDCLPAAAAVTRFHRDHAAIYQDLLPAARVGLIKPDSLSTSPDRYSDSLSEYHGLFSSLVERHVPFDIVPAGSLARVPLARFHVLVLPDLPVLKEDQDGALENFVRNGGRVLATGASGVRHDGTVSDWLPGERRTNVHCDPHALKSSYVQVDRSDQVEGSALVPRYGRHHSLLWRIDARLRHRVVPSAPYGPPEKAYGHVHGGEHALGERSFGAGRAIQVPWTPGSAYRDLSLTRIRDAAVDLVVELLGPDVQVTVEAPEQLEVVLGHSDAGLVIHLLNHSGQRRNGFGPAVPFTGVTVRVPGAAGQRVHSLVSPEGMSTTIVGNDLVLTLDEVGDFEVLVLEGRQP
ncbi:beta-galactosidase trimerization domain-containing protein [Arthrobacter sp. JZ12]|uniref:beta-galactosidase trimerization domain-containing protein n=1 Tax=Arthrobacter sp. JZ12 TaxID=2654190 RepID=UPI002B47CA4E|nr:beta-galactosidase trimerization domain-containing protein [Arthrobacter sp. JZ12]